VSEDAAAVAPRSPAGAWRTWLAIGATGFGGPAGQVALIHREVVERRRWLDEEEFLAALRLCMLLPGPEAQQLVTYAGWRLGGIGGGVVAGTLFVLPGALLVMGLSWLHAAGREVPIVAAAFAGVRPAVVALLLERLRSSGARWVVPQVRGHPQVLLSALRGNLRGAIERHLAAGRRDLRGLVETLAAADPAAVCRLDAAAFAAVDPELESFRDIDTPEDLAALTAPRASAAASPARSPPAPGTPGGTG